MPKFSLRYSHFYLALAILIALAVFVSIRWLTIKTQPPSLIENKNTSSKITVGLKWVNQAQFAGMYVAKDKGFYKEAGLDVDLKERNPKDKLLPIDELKSGAIDIAIVNPYELLVHRAEKQPIKAVAAVFQVSPIILVSLQKNNIKSPKDFRNKTLGTIGGEGITPSFFHSLLTKYNVPINTVVFVDSGTNVADALLEKQVDVVSTYRTNFYKPTGGIEKYQILKPEDFGVSTYDDIIVANENYLRKYPEKIKKFLNATNQGWQYAIKHPDEAAQISYNYASGVEKNLDRQKYILNQVDLLITPPGHQFGQMRTETWKKTYDYLKEYLISPNFDYTKAFTNEFLPY